MQTKKSFISTPNMLFVENDGRVKGHCCLGPEAQHIGDITDILLKLLGGAVALPYLCFTQYIRMC